MEVLLIWTHLLKNLRTQPDYHLDDEAFIRPSEKGIFLGVHKSNQQLQIREKKMRTKYLVLGCIAAVGVAVISSPAKAGLSFNGLSNNSASPNSQVSQNTMPNATGLTLTSPGYTSLQVEGGHLVGIK